MQPHRKSSAKMVSFLGCCLDENTCTARPKPTMPTSGGGPAATAWLPVMAGSSRRSPSAPPGTSAEILQFLWSGFNTSHNKQADPCSCTGADTCGIYAQSGAGCILLTGTAGAKVCQPGGEARQVLPALPAAGQLLELGCQGGSLLGEGPGMGKRACIIRVHGPSQNV